MIDHLADIKRRRPDPGRVLLTDLDWLIDEVEKLEAQLAIAQSRQTEAEMQATRDAARADENAAALAAELKEKL